MRSQILAKSICMSLFSKMTLKTKMNKVKGMKTIYKEWSQNI